MVRYVGSKVCFGWLLISLLHAGQGARADSVVGCDPDSMTRANDLINAVATEVTAGGTQTITLASMCTYTLTAVNNGSGVDTNGLPVIGNNVDLTIDGNGSTITRGGMTDFRFLQIDIGATLALNDLTFTNGKTPDGADGTGNDGGHGGAILNAGTLNVDGCTFQANWTGDGGDGIMGSIPGGNGGWGGAISSSGALDVVDSTFTGNWTGDGGTFLVNGSGGEGGAIYNSGTATIANSRFESNQTGVGGMGPYIGGGRGPGGAIYSNDMLAVTDSTFVTNNSALGGAIENYAGTTEVRSSTFESNGATNGGGLSNYSGGTLTVTNSTIAGNAASTNGGGLWSEGTLTVTNSTITGNTASGGGGVHLESGSATLSNTIVSANTPGNCNTAVTDGGSNIDSGTSCGFSMANDSQPSTDPLLDPLGLQNNGGGTETIALQMTSPAINTGSNTICAAAPVSDRDQRGYVRPAGAQCDIGAFEFGAVTPAPTATVTATITVTPTVTPTATILADCPAIPPICETPAKSKLLVKDASPDAGKDKFKWKFKGGATDLTVAQLGDPTSGTVYSLCLYYGAALQSEIRLTDASKWTATGTSGYKYNDSAGAGDGITKAILKAGAAGKSKVIFKGKGDNLPDPLPIAPIPPNVTVVVQNSSTSTCFSAVYSTAKKNEVDFLKAP